MYSTRTIGANMKALCLSIFISLITNAGVILTVDHYRALAVVILSLGTYLVFSLGRLDGAKGMFNYISREIEKELNDA